MKPSQIALIAIFGLICAFGQRNNDKPFNRGLFEHKEKEEVVLNIRSIR